MEQDYPNLFIESKEEIALYLYSGRVPLLSSFAVHLFPQANRLKMDKLKQLCETVEFLFNNTLLKNLRPFAKDYQWKMLANT